VSSTSSLAVFRIDPINSPQSPIIHIATSRCDDLGQDILFLQCNWHPLYTHTLGLTTSTGLARLVYLDSDWCIRDSRDLDIQNSLEAWSIAFSPRGDGEAQDDCTIYCGGDDSTLNYNTYQTIPNSGDEAWSSEAPFASVAIRGVHDAGVTAILPLACEDGAGGRLVVTGSYDDHIRLLAIHDLDKTYGMKRVKVLAEENLGGGVWRLDLVEHSRLAGGGEKVLILASCMHGGSRVVEMRQAGEDRVWTWMILARFEEHKSMNYGCSFVAQGDGSERRLQCVSTSFYDKLLCLWEYSPARAVELE
jgi:diphthine methyl ester acylhydrolase